MYNKTDKTKHKYPQDGMLCNILETDGANMLEKEKVNCEWAQTALKINFGSNKINEIAFP